MNRIESPSKQRTRPWQLRSLACGANTGPPSGTCSLPNSRTRLLCTWRTRTQRIELDVLLVDEYQDLNKADIKLISEIARRGVSVLAIGDDDQSIYRFRMAAPQGIRDFPQDFPGAC